MIRRPRLSVLLGIAIVASFPIERRFLLATEPPPTHLEKGSDGLIHDSGIVHFRLVLGRLELDPARHRKGSKTATREAPDPLTETITVDSRRGIPSLHYTFETTTQQAIVDVVDAQRVQILSQRVDRPERVTLTQPVTGPITVQVDQAAGDQTLHVASLLHFQAAHPQLFDDHLQPLLPYLLEGPSLTTLRIAAAEQMVQVTVGRRLPMADEVRDCLDQMRSPKRSVRSAAEAELLSFGLPVMRQLDAIPNDRLDAEQAARVQRIRLTLRPRQHDTASQLASWLATDRDYWNLAVVDLSPPDRLLVDRAITRACGQGLDASVLHHDGIRIAEAVPKFTR